MMKRKFLIPMVALLLCVGMCSVGFAAWVITTKTTDNASGQFTVYDVQNKSVTFTSAVDATDKIVFGEAAFDTNMGTNYGWLTLEEDSAEDLTATLKITITNWSELSGQKVRFNISEVSPSVTIADTYVVTPAAQSITFTVGNNVTGLPNGVILDTSNSSAVVLSVPLNFAWGSQFVPTGKTVAVNPITYFNMIDVSQTANASYITTAQTALGEIYKLNEANYSVTVTAQVVVD